MKPPYTPRIKGLNVAFVSDRLNDRLRSRAEVFQEIRDEPDRLLQIRMSSLQTSCWDIALYRYALGFPLDQVRQDLAEAAAACLRIFELRGTAEAFPVVVLTVDPTKPEDDPGAAVERPLHPPGTRDYSLTNSHACFQGICLALTAGMSATAEKLAELMGDPPSAGYIGPRSEVCTPNQQYLAYAVKGLLLNQPEVAARELKRVGGYRKSDAEALSTAQVVRGLIEESDVIFSEGLQELLAWHRKEARKPSNQFDPEMYVCLPAVGLCVLAVRGGLLAKAQLPADPYLPLELMPENTGQRGP